MRTESVDYDEYRHHVICDNIYFLFGPTPVLQIGTLFYTSTSYTRVMVITLKVQCSIFGVHSFRFPFFKETFPTTIIVKCCYLNKGWQRPPYSCVILDCSLNQGRTLGMQIIDEFIVSCLALSINLRWVDKRMLSPNLNISMSLSFEACTFDHRSSGCVWPSLPPWPVSGPVLLEWAFLSHHLAWQWSLGHLAGQPEINHERH